MTLNFSTVYPEFMGELAGQPAYFVEKIWCGLIQNELSIRAEDLYYSQNGKKFEAYSNRPAKLHTIRADKHNRWKVGSKIHFTINSRTKDRFQFAPVLEVKSIQKIEIKYTKSSNGIPLVSIMIESTKTKDYMLCFDTYNPETKQSSFGNIELLAQNDGFDSVDDFFKWFDKDFSGKIISWTDLKY